MKNLLLGLALFTFGFSVQSQSLVVTSPQQKNAILEEFTALNCGNCPDAHRMVASMQETYGARLIPINIHYGSLANPRPGQDDLRTEFSNPLGAQAGVGAVPQGSINRNLNGWATSRSRWIDNVEATLAQPSPVNLGFTVNSNPNTGNINLFIESFNNEEVSSLNYHVALVENNVIAFQQDYTQGAHQNYNHQHALRDLPLGIDGAALNDLTTAAVNSFETSFNLPNSGSSDLANYDIVVFASDDAGNVFTGGMLPATGGSNNGSTSTASGIFSPSNAFSETLAFPIPAVNELNIQLKNRANQKVQVVLFGLSGKNLQSSIQQSNAQGTLTFSVSTLTNGIYFYKVFDGQNQLANGKFEVRR